MSKTLKTFNSLKKYPFGKTLFSHLVCFQAPYFKTIKPRFIELEPGRCVIKIKKRRSVTNHLKTIHAIAMCNLVELAGGIGVDVSIPSTLRWIPVGMTVEYLSLAKTDLTGVFEADIEALKNWDTKKNYPATVNCYDNNGQVVMKGTINIRLSHKKKTD